MSHLDPDIAALVALGEEIPRADRAHLDTCAECAAEVAAYGRAIAAGRSAAGSEPLLTPPPRVWDAISAELGLREPTAEGAAAESATPSQMPTASEPASAPTSAPEPEPSHVAPRRPRRRARRGVVFALVAAVAAVAIVAGTWIAGELNRSRVSVLAAAVLDAFPDHPGAEGEAVLEEADGHTRIIVSLDADLAADGYREVWLLAADGSGLVSLGVLDGERGVFTVPADVDTGLFSLVDISQEEADGDPGHSGDSIVRGELRPA